MIKMLDYQNQENTCKNLIEENVNIFCINWMLMFKKRSKLTKNFPYNFKVLEIIT